MSAQRNWHARFPWICLLCFAVTMAMAQQRVVTVVVERAPSNETLDGVDVWITNADGGPTSSRGERQITLPTNFKDETVVQVQVRGWRVIYPPDGWAPIPRSESCFIYVVVVRRNEQLIVVGTGARAEPTRKRPQKPRPHPQSLFSIIPRKQSASYGSSSVHHVSRPGYITNVSLVFQEMRARVELSAANSLDDIAIMKTQAEQYYQKGRYREAEKLYLQALESDTDRLGLHAKPVARDWSNLAKISYAEARFSEAERRYKYALEIDQASNSESADLANDFANLGDIYYAQLRDSDAEVAFTTALFIAKKVLGPTHPDVASDVKKLAALQVREGRYDEAKAMYQEALLIDRALEAHESEMARTLSNLAWIYNVQGDYAQAEKLYQEALLITQKRFGAEDPQVARIQGSLGSVYTNEGKYDQALQFLSHALVTDEETLGPSPAVATDLSNLAELYRKQGRFAEAEPLLRRAVEILETTLGPKDRQLASSLNNLAVLYSNEGNYLQAEMLYKRALSIDEEQTGSDSPAVATDLNNLAALYESQGRPGQSEPLYKRALAIGEKSLKPSDPTLATYAENLAKLYTSRGEYAKAEPLLKRAVAIHEKAPSNLHTAAVLEDLASVLLKLGRVGEAKIYKERAATIRSSLSRGLDTSPQGKIE